METEPNFQYYIDHYFELPTCLYFAGLCLGVLFVLFVILYIYTLVCATGLKGMQRHEFVRIEWHVLVERYYEMVFSGTSILFFMAVYYLIERFITAEPFRSNWEKYSDFYLMILIIMSCMFNSFLDRVFVRFKFLNRDEKSAGRLTGMVYMILIFCYIKFVYQNNNYDMFIAYFLGLMVGRFAYFDSTVHDFVKAMMGVKKNLGLLIFLIINTSIVCYVGFKSDYLITHNGVITNVFIAHLVMCLAIFVLHHLHIAELVTGRGTRQSKYAQMQNRADEEEYYEDDYSEYDNAEEYYEDSYYEGESGDEEFEDEEFEDEGPEDDDIELIDINY